MFGCYDADCSGLISQQEVFDLGKQAPIDGPIERDLVALVRQGKKEYTLSDYIEHVKSGSECEVIARMQKVLKMDPSTLPTDEKILGSKAARKSLSK